MSKRSKRYIRTPEELKPKHIEFLQRLGQAPAYQARELFQKEFAPKVIHHSVVRGILPGHRSHGGCKGHKYETKRRGARCYRRS